MKEWSTNDGNAKLDATKQATIPLGRIIECADALSAAAERLEKLGNAIVGVEPEKKKTAKEETAKEKFDGTTLQGILQCHCVFVFRITDGMNKDVSRIEAALGLFGLATTSPPS